MNTRLTYKLFLVLCFPALFFSSCLAEPSTFKCSLDKSVFYDNKKGKRFYVERVALDIQYLCGKRLIDAKAERPDLEKRCRGPLGDYVLEGRYEGKTTYAVLTIIPGSPCCTWKSYAAGQLKTLNVPVWLPSVKAPKLVIGEWNEDDWSIADTGFGNKVGGPLEGLALKPSECRKR